MNIFLCKKIPIFAVLMASISVPSEWCSHAPDTTDASKLSQNQENHEKHKIRNKVTLLALVVGLVDLSEIMSWKLVFSVFY